MPVMIPVQVQIPPSFLLRVEDIQSQLTEYAQSLIDNTVSASPKIYSAAELASHTCTPEELRDDLLHRVKAHFHSKA